MNFSIELPAAQLSRGKRFKMHFFLTLAYSLLVGVAFFIIFQLLHLNNARIILVVIWLSCFLDLYFTSFFQLDIIGVNTVSGRFQVTDGGIRKTVGQVTTEYPWSQFRRYSIIRADGKMGSWQWSNGRAFLYRSTYFGLYPKVLQMPKVPGMSYIRLYRGMTNYNFMLVPIQEENVSEAQAFLKQKFS